MLLNSAYECGFIPASDTRIQFNINFYVIAILFLIFDVEVMFLFPWAASVEYCTNYSSIVLVVVMVLVVIGYVVEIVGGTINII